MLLNTGLDFNKQRGGKWYEKRHGGRESGDRSREQVIQFSCIVGEGKKPSIDGLGIDHKEA